MKRLTLLSVAAIACALLQPPAASARSLPEPQAETHWIEAVQRQIDAGFQAPATSYAKRRFTADVRFDLGDDGTILNPTISQTSGSALVDEAVLEAVAHAGALPPPPASLNGSAVVFRGTVDASKRGGSPW